MQWVKTHPRKASCPALCRYEPPNHEALAQRKSTTPNLRLRIQGLSNQLDALDRSGESLGHRPRHASEGEVDQDGLHIVILAFAMAPSDELPS